MKYLKLYEGFHPVGAKTFSKFNSKCVELEKPLEDYINKMGEYIEHHLVPLTDSIGHPFIFKKHSTKTSYGYKFVYNIDTDEYDDAITFKTEYSFLEFNDELSNFVKEMSKTFIVTTHIIGDGFNQKYVWVDDKCNVIIDSNPKTWTWESEVYEIDIELR